MALWDKIKFFYDHMLDNTGATLTASSTATGDYDVDYIANMLEVNMWKSATTTTPLTLTLDLGVGNTATADYLIIYGHNLNTAGATVALEYSATGAWAGEEADAFTPVAPSADTVFLKEFTAPSAVRYWRIKITGTLSVAPYISIGIWGQKTEVDYASIPYDPYRQDIEGMVNRSYGGKVTGIYEQYRDRILDIIIDDADTTVYNKIKTWFESTWTQFFITWDTANNPNDCWLVWSNPSMNNSFKENGTYRTINLSLRGRKE